MQRDILTVNNLKVSFPLFGGILQRRVAQIVAVDSVSFSLKKGETIGLVGESGSGKSTIGKAISNLLWVTAPFVSIKGTIELAIHDSPVNLLTLTRHHMAPYRKYIQMIFQDPYSSLNPRMIVRDIIRESLDINEPTMSHKQKNEKVVWLMEKVGMNAEQATRYPHEFSGGQRQRIGIARSLATNPLVIIADEPVSALDVSIRAQVINLMQDLQEEFGLSYIFIAHDLSVIEHMCTRIAVMYMGSLVEIGTNSDVYNNPKHPYTQSLLSAVPLPDPQQRDKKRQILQGDMPSQLAKPSGCCFRTRCPIAKPACRIEKPAYKEYENGHRAACPYQE